MYNQFDLLGDGEQQNLHVNGLKHSTDELNAFNTASAPSDPNFSQNSDNKTTTNGLDVGGHLRSIISHHADTVAHNTFQAGTTCCEDGICGNNCACSLLNRWYKTATQFVFESSHNNIVHELIYWRSPLQSGLCLSLSLCLIVALKYWSTLAVISFCCLSLMILSGFYKLACSLSTSIVGHSLPQLPSALSTTWKIDDTSNQRVEQTIKQANRFLHWLQAVLLWDQIIQSVLVMAFAFLSFHIGKSFDTLTIVLLKLIFFFTVPYLYSRNQHHIQAGLERIRTVTAQSKEALIQRIRGLSGSSGNVSPVTHQKDL